MRLSEEHCTFIFIYFTRYPTLSKQCYVECSVNWIILFEPDIFPYNYTSRSFYEGALDTPIPLEHKVQRFLWAVVCGDVHESRVNL